jgi:hypothetical protein
MCSSKQSVDVSALSFSKMPSMPAVHKKLRTFESVHSTDGSVFFTVISITCGGVGGDYRYQVLILFAYD